ncbi:HNH endonuclease [Pacificoceanicola onchidii]|uniref:HNH endonuclease n=1 Tax=Pacificoceanicola onchidii TaxID=2562685 RepID=UPI001455FFB1|nr:HNH endonuclease signature motif containing protein [Pacificoceanicola onchidii]
MLVNSLQEIRNNLFYLEAARREPIAQKTYRALISRGRVFLPYMASNAINFAPSRFIGYASNSFTRHEANASKHGWDTTVSIRKIISETHPRQIYNQPNEPLEIAFLKFCERNGITALNQKRTYWKLPEHIALSEESSARNLMDFEVSRLETTVRDQISKARVGQGKFRSEVLRRYKSCSVTGVNDPILLTASHIKPWSQCWQSPTEALSPDNALLLSPTWDRLFDTGLVTFQESGRVMLSKCLDKEDFTKLGLNPSASVSLTKAQNQFMEFHRSAVFRKHTVL